MSLFFVLLLVFFFLCYGWFAVRTKKEQELLKSKVYADAISDLEHVQIWYVATHPKKMLPYRRLLDTGRIVGTDVCVYEDEDKKMVIPDNLSPAEMVLLAKYLRIEAEKFGADKNLFSVVTENV